ncbi:hypothetical protein EYF80_035815 [Liparis tanakae]|uniref:Uncharacterized protein n=1 Tax=Liparis tanakae TaxID=230148 RepID=A0A4Z2GL96_9TELE|nr:hypothetical protein EYF80_035815 [Liparis tanakae]
MFKLCLCKGKCFDHQLPSNFSQLPIVLDDGPKEKVSARVPRSISMGLLEWLLGNRAVDPLGQLAEEDAAGQLLVELTQSVLVLQEIPQTHAVLQQQTNKLRLVADQGGEHGPVEISVSAKSTRFQVIASSSCLFQLSIPSVSLFLEAEWKLTNFFINWWMRAMEIRDNGRPATWEITSAILPEPSRTTHGVPFSMAL